MRSVIPPWSTNGLPSSERTLADLLAPAGYQRRAIIGKWHLGHARKEFLPLARGFTSFYGHYNGAIDYFDHTREGEVDWHRNEQTVVEQGYSTDLLGAEAVRFINEAPLGEPWLLYLPFNAPHEPLEAKPEDLAKYTQLKNESHRKYAAMVDRLDQAVGRVLDAVKARPDATNTLTLFFSDNGGIPRVGSSNAPWRDGKLSVYEGGTRVCACIRWPAAGLTGGRKYAGRIGYIDVLPTLLAAAAQKPPQNLDGIDLLPVLRGKSPLPERDWFSYVHQTEKAHASVHEGKWKLVVHGDVFGEKPGQPSPTELYDLDSDPGEKTDCAATHPEVVSNLQNKLREFGKLRTQDAGGFNAGREGFRAPKDWIIRDESTVTNRLRAL